MPDTTIASRARMDISGGKILVEGKRETIADPWYETPMKTPKTFRGMWRIIETEMWEQDALDLVVPAHVTFDKEGLGGFQLVAVNAEIDCRFEQHRVEFSWKGDDDGEDATGRGWAEVKSDGTLAGMIFFHLGDESSFLAKRVK